MGFLMVLIGAFIAWGIYEDVEEVVTQKQWVGFGFAALLILLGGVLALVRPND